MQILYQLIGLVGLVCMIMVIVQMFKTSTLQGVLGIIFCFIWPLVWGLINMKKPNVKRSIWSWIFASTLKAIASVAIENGCNKFSFTSSVTALNLLLLGVK